METAAKENSTPYLFSQQPTLHFRPKQSRCPKCRAKLNVQKTRVRTLRTLHLGEFFAHETLMYCDQCENSTVYTAKDLSRMAPAGGTFGYDVLVFVGKALFLRHRQTEEIIDELLASDHQAIRMRLRKHGISSKLLYRAKRLKTQIDQQPELIDDFVQSLQHTPEPSAHIDSIPLLSAYSLIQWALAGKTQGDGYGFPFDRTQVIFAKRLISVYSQLEPIKDIQLRGQWRDNIPLFNLSLDLKKVASDRGLQKMIAEFEAKAAVFDQLRKAMRIALEGGADGLNSGSDPAMMGPIKKAVTKFRKRITTRSDYPSHPGYQKMIGQMDKYWDKLFADPILIQTPTGPICVQPQRTNNIMERFFRDFRRDARRKSGTNSISRTLQSMIGDTPLVKNLEKPKYIELLLNGLPSLEDRFAQMDITAVRRAFNAASQSTDRIPVKIRNVIDCVAFPNIVSNLFQKCA